NFKAEHVQRLWVLQTHLDANERIQALRTQIQNGMPALPEEARVRAASLLARLAKAETKLSTDASTVASAGALDAEARRGATLEVASGTRALHTELAMLEATPHLSSVDAHVDTVIASAPPHVREELASYRAFLTALATGTPEHAA